VGIRLFFAPFWVRWLATGLLLSAWLLGAAWVGTRNRGNFPGPAWAVATVLGFAFAASALSTLAQRPVQRSFAAAVAGLGAAQRVQAFKALRRGEAPSDPRVLAAAVRVGALSMAYRRRQSRRQRVGRWVALGLLLVAVVLAAIGRDVRTAVLWAGLMVMLAVLVGLAEYRRRRLPRHLDALRSAAAAQGLSAPAGVDGPVAESPPRWMSVLLVVLIGVGGGLVGYLSVRPRPECRTADAVVNFIAAHREMLDPALITPGWPALDQYQGWSDQLNRYSRQVSASDLAPHLQRIASYSDQAVSLVRDARSAENPSPADVSSRRAAYQVIVGELVDEDKTLVPICHRQ
jgi:hypothetical protein